VNGINGGLSLVDADNLESEVWGADHGSNHDSHATKAALEANNSLAAASSSLTEVLEKDYAQKYEQLMAEEAAKEAAESAASAAAQAAAVDAPAALSAADPRPGIATCEAFRDPYFDGRLFNFDSCHLSPLHCKPSYCASYPDDFMMECASDTEARAVVKGMPNAKWGVSEAERDAVSGDATMPKLEVQAGLEKLICCPVSKVDRSSAPRSVLIRLNACAMVFLCLSKSLLDLWQAALEDLITWQPCQTYAIRLVLPQHQISGAAGLRAALTVN